MIALQFEQRIALPRRFVCERHWHALAGYSTWVVEMILVSVFHEDPYFLRRDGRHHINCPCR